MITPVRGRSRTPRRGATQVEMALVLLLCCMLLVAFVELGRMLLVYNTVANAARAGVRYAIVNGNAEYTRPGSGPDDNPGDVVAVVKNFASAGPLDTSLLVANCTPDGNSRICVTYPGGTPRCVGALNAPGCPVDVTVVYRYDPLSVYFPLSVPLGSTSRGVITF